MKEYTIESDVYPMTYVFVIAKSHKKVLKKYGILWNEAGGCCYHEDRIWIIIHPKETLDTLVHECDHAISQSWKELGIKKLKGMDECYSYMLGWIFKKCYKKWKKNKK
jgi:hypothetical protein